MPKPSLPQIISLTAPPSDVEIYNRDLHRDLESVFSQINGSLAQTMPKATIFNYSSDYNLNTGIFLNLIDASSAAVQVDLPTAASVPDEIFTFKKIDATVNAVTLQADGSETIDGSNTWSTTTQYDKVTLISDGTEWWII